MLDREPQAREQMRRALEIAPADADVLFRAAILYNHSGDTEKTLDFLTKSVAAGGSRTEIRDTPDFDRLKDVRRYRALLPSDN
jgi:predicted TPR repeat methyltransferase